jgi:hypothetical protein
VKAGCIERMVCVTMDQGASMQAGRGQAWAVPMVSRLPMVSEVTQALESENIAMHRAVGPVTALALGGWCP